MLIHLFGIEHVAPLSDGNEVLLGILLAFLTS